MFIRVQIVGQYVWIIWVFVFFVGQDNGFCVVVEQYIGCVVCLVDDVRYGFSINDDCVVSLVVCDEIICD